MARITYFDALGDYGTPSDFILDGPLDPTVMSATELTVVDENGAGVTLIGSGLRYGPFGATQGTISSIVVFDAEGNELVRIDNIHPEVGNAAALSMLVNSQGIDSALLLLASRNDRIDGSANGDVLVGSGGRDTIRGFDGDDVIGGSVGNDTMTGGNGKDHFIFVRGDGVDTVTDFTDQRGANEDKIGVTRALFNNMTVEDTADGALITFNPRTQVLLLGVDAADIAREDFIFG